MNELMTINQNPLAKCSAEETAFINSIFEVGAAKEENEIRFSTTDNEAMLFNAINDVPEKVGDHIGEEIHVSAFVVSDSNISADFNDDSENAEKVNHPVVHFFTSDGQHYSSIANGIIRSVKNLLKASIIPSESAPIRIRFKVVKTKAGNSHRFDYLGRVSESEIVNFSD